MVKKNGENVLHFDKHVAKLKGYTEENTKVVNKDLDAYIPKEWPNTWHRKALEFRVAVAINTIDKPEGAQLDTLKKISRELGQIAAISKLDREKTKEIIKSACEGSTTEKLSDERLQKISDTVEESFSKGLTEKLEQPHWIDFVGKESDVDINSIFNLESFIAWMGIDIRFNEFALQFDLTGFKKYRELDDNAQQEIWGEAQKIGYRVSQAYLFSGLNTIGLGNSYHPVRDYLDTLKGKWDGVKRIDRLFVDYFGAEESDYINVIGAITLIAMVRRIRQPGIKFDQMVVLEGFQGTGKSSALAILAVHPEWFTDSMTLTMKQKEVIEISQGQWLVEIPELQNFGKAALDQVKAFMRRYVDKSRLTYGRRRTNAPRQFIMWGTINIEIGDDGKERCEYLRDRTGNRAWWPVRTKGKIKLEELQRDVEQIWAEANERERNGESIVLPESLWDAAKVEQDKRMEVDPWISVLEDKLAGLQGKIIADDVSLLLDLKTDKLNKAMETKRGNAMKSLGWDKKRITTSHGTRKGEQVSHYWKGPEPLEDIVVWLDRRTQRYVAGYASDYKEYQKNHPNDI